MTRSIGTPSRTAWPASEYHRLTIVYKAQGVDPAFKLIRATFNPKFKVQARDDSYLGATTQQFTGPKRSLGNILRQKQHTPDILCPCQTGQSGFSEIKT